MNFLLRLEGSKSPNVLVRLNTATQKIHVHVRTDDTTPQTQDAENLLALEVLMRPA